MIGLRLTPGQVIDQRYHVLRALAEGGMGSVYAVREESTGRELALKVLHPELVANASSRDRFAREAQIVRQLKSPHVVRVENAAIDAATGLPFIAMELLPGQTLARHVEARGRLTTEEAWAILAPIGEALAEAHALGLIHRDLKPDNIFVVDPAVPRVKLLDFGVAKVIDPNRTSGLGTTAVGSPMWMAPEQTTGGNRIAPATDVWGMALLSFWMLTGRNFWVSAQPENKNMAGLLKELHLDEIPKASARAAALGVDVTFELGYDAWFDKALRRDGRERYRTAEEATQALRSVLGPHRRRRSESLAYASTVEADISALRAKAEETMARASRSSSARANRPGSRTLNMGSGAHPRPGTTGEEDSETAVTTRIDVRRVAEARRAYLEKHPPLQPRPIDAEGHAGGPAGSPVLTATDPSRPTDDPEAGAAKRPMWMYAVAVLVLVAVLLTCTAAGMATMWMMSETREAARDIPGRYATTSEIVP
ncbi:MAG: serine/threonine-protein kinase [Sandaracinaceae bacterium]